MAGEWTTLTLGDLGRVVTGKTPSTSVAENFGGDIPFITPSDMDGRRVIGETARYLTKTGAESVKGVRIPKAAVLVSCIGSDMGKTAIAAHDSVTNQQINSIIVNDEFCSEFVYYNLSTRKHEIRHEAAGGSAQPILNKSAFSKLTITLPPLPEQKAIARILGTLDDKIELNRRINATLEAMARALFQSWFVDFDPVHVLAGTKPEQPPFLSAEALAKAGFPNTFQDSELGPIPEGWEIGTISDLTQFSRSSLTPANFPDEVFDHYSLPAFDEGRTPKLELGGDIKSNKLTVPPSAVLLSKLNPHIPRIWAPSINGKRRGICSTEFLVASPTALASREFLFFLFTSDAFSRVYGTLVTGTTGSHQRIKAESVLATSTAVPPAALVEGFTAIAKPILACINQNIEQSRTLSTLRDTLLPELLSGDISMA